MALILGLVPGAASIAARPIQPSCPRCVAAAIAPAQSRLLPAGLNGLTVIVRDEEGRPDDVGGAVREIEARGGRPAILVGGAGSSDPRQAYALKLRLTEWRARLGPKIRLAVDASVDRSLYGYVDALVGSAREIRAGPPLWPLLTDGGLPAALAATRAGGAELWVIPTPPDAAAAAALLRDLAAAAAPPTDAFTEDVDVRGARRLTVAEIVARHQAFARGQAERAMRVISSGQLTLTFEAPGFPAPVTIGSDTVIYASPGLTEIEQRAIRVNGIEFKGGAVPRLPIVEPERVASPPLAIALTDRYRYRLAGEEDVSGVRCYVVAFEPLDGNGPSFRGRAWIAADSFAMVRVAAAQTGLRGAIVSSEQVDDFRRSSGGLWLLARSDVRQIYEGAAHRTPIHRVLVVDSHEVDPPDFEARLREAYVSAPVMLRDTPAGYRYLKRPPRDRAGAPSNAAVAPAVAAPVTRVRTLAAGIIVDPNISVPLPFAGLSYVDFDFLGRGAQLNAFAGGTYGQLAFSLPALGRTRWQLGGRAFAIATSYNDRSFRDGREVYEENLRQRPAHASTWLLHAITPRVAARATYELDYTNLAAAPETAPAFVVPANQLVHGLKLSLEGQRAGWSGSLWWNPASRVGWRTWGRTADDYSPRHAAFQRYGGSLARSDRLHSSLGMRIEAAVMGGADLDRFSRYTFGTFDNRLHGYPSALVRYDRGAVFRGSLAWSAGRVARLDGFLDSAVVRDRGFGRAYRTYTGTGAALEMPAPFGILGAIEWGYGFRGLDADGSRGTHVIRVSAYKMF